MIHVYYAPWLQLQNWFKDRLWGHVFWDTFESKLCWQTGLRKIQFYVSNNRTPRAGPTFNWNIYINEKSWRSVYFGVVFSTEKSFYVHFLICGWLSRALVLGSFQCRGVLLLWNIVGQRPAVLAGAAGRVGCYFILFYFIFFFFFFFL